MEEEKLVRSGWVWEGWEGCADRGVGSAEGACLGSDFMAIGRGGWLVGLVAVRRWERRRGIYGVYSAPGSSLRSVIMSMSWGSVSGVGMLCGAEGRLY